jgi:hypothetical protein
MLLCAGETKVKYCTNVLTLLTPWSRVLLEKLIVTQLVKRFPIFLCDPKVHYGVHKCPEWPLSWARWIQSVPSHPISLQSILTLPSHLHLHLPSGLFPSAFPIKILCVLSMPCNDMPYNHNKKTHTLDLCIALHSVTSSFKVPSPTCWYYWRWRFMKHDNFS